MLVCYLWLRVEKYNFPPTSLVTQDVNNARENFFRAEKAFSLISKFELQNFSLNKNEIKMEPVKRIIIV